VRQLEFDQGMETFAAVVLTSFGHEILPGSVKALIEVPAPRDRVRAGTTLTADMFSTIAIDALSTDRDYVAALSQLVGKQARRSLSPGKPVRADYVSQPTVVRADELIRLVYETNQVRITVKGKALEDGAVGETIRVVNVRSNKTLTGIVRGPSQVAVAY
jgi:flagella basal body P-ring formation protein FlgA